MASLSNINGLFDVHSTGAILFSTSHGTSGQILRSNGNAAPTWVDASTVIGGPYLPLSGGTLTGATATASGISFTVAGDFKLDGIDGGHFENYTYGTQLNISELNTGGWARANRIITSDSGGDVFYGVLGNNTTITYAYWNIGDGSNDTTNYNNANGVFLTRAGNVGIGTISPGKKLEVNGSFKLGTNAYIEYGGVYPYTITTANTAAVGNLVFSAGLGSAAYESKIDLQGTNTAGAAGITLSTASTPRITVTADGKIGLRKTNPYYDVDATSFGANQYEWGSALSVFGQDRYSIRELNNLFYSADSRVGGIGTSANLSSAMFDGNFDTGHSIAANTTYVVEMDGSGTWNMTYPSGYALISFYYIYNDFTSIVGEQYHFAGTYSGQWRTMGTAVTIRGSAGSGVRVVRINSAGNNYVSKWRFTFVTGSTSINVTDIAFYGTRTAGAPVSTYMRGDRTNEWTRMIRFRNNANGIVGSIVPGNTSTTFNTTSDYRLKEDLKDFAGLDMVSKIPVYDFRWINSEKRSYGVLAHELNEVYPEAVEGKKDAEENQCVDYSKIVPLLVKSIQELEARVKELENK